MVITPRIYIELAIAGVLALCLTHSVTGQIQERQSRSNVDLIVQGRVANVFRGSSSEDEYLVQILVQRSEAPRLQEAMVNTRFPAPGEYVYAHVNLRENRVARASRRSVIPEPQMYIRANLSVGAGRRWEGGAPGWYEETSETEGLGELGTRPGTPFPDSLSLGISSERISLGLGNALKVIRVEERSPAAKAGIEAGDILVKANGESISSPEQLAATFRNSDGTLTLAVRDVRTGRDVVVNVELERKPGKNGSPKRLGVKTELAFYGGEAAVKVTEVEPDSPAERAGIVPGLLILKANGNRILHPDKLAETNAV